MKNTTKFIATLALMLTLGVGQMWGYYISSNTTLYFYEYHSWGSVNLYIWSDGKNYKNNHGMTPITGTPYYYFTQGGSNYSDISGLLFNKAKDDWTNKSSNVYTDITTDRVYRQDGNKYEKDGGGVWKATTNATLYFDNTNFGYTGTIYFRSGFTGCNVAFAMEKVSGTSNLYKVSIPQYLPYEAYCFANNRAYTGENSIYDVNVADDTYDVTKSTNHEKSNITGEKLFYNGVYSSESNGCTYYSYSTASSHTHNVAITAPSHGTIRVDYTNESNSADYFTSGNRDLAHTCNLTITATPASGYSRTGLTLNGDAFTSGGSHTLRSDITLAATFAANEYTLTFNKNGETWGAGSSDLNNTRKIVYDAAYSSSYESQGAIPTMATKNGYYFKGWYTESSGGTKVINADGTWVTGVSGYTDGSGRWVHADNQTLYAQYGAPEISIGFSPENVLPLDTVTITPSFDHDPEGASTLCYVLVTASGQEMQVQPTWVPGTGNAMKFEAPSAPGDYSVDVRLFNAADHSCADRTTGLVSSYLSRATTFTVEEANAVTVKYKCGNVELRPSTTVYATAYQTAANVTAPEIAGLSFTGWTKDAQISYASGSSSTPEISIHASSAGTLTANYSQTGYVYFKNTLGWEHVYLYKYNSNNYWGSSNPNYGTGACKEHAGWADLCTYGPEEMTKVEGTEDLYAIKPADGVPASGKSFVFTNSPSTEDFFGETVGTSIEVVRVTTNYDATNHMIVPNKDGQTQQYYSNRVKYYLNYFEAPTLMDWDWTLRGEWGWSTPSEYGHFTAPKMGSITFQAKHYFDAAGLEKYFLVYDQDGAARGNSGAVIDGTTTTPTEIATGSNLNVKVKTTYRGEYIFNLTFGHATNQVGGFSNKIHVSVTYPVKAGDYRLFYTTKNHPGDVISKRANGKDTVSMYVDNADNLKIQTCASVAATSVTWNSPAVVSYADGVNFATILSEGGAGVYNFVVEQDANGANPKITAVEKYTGNYYIRTDCTNSYKKNYKDVADACKMTYSEYSMSSALAADKQFSHYYVKDLHGESGAIDIRFTVATDYSESITDTVTTGITTPSSDPHYDFYGNVSLNRVANVRFSYNEKTNEIWRAYTEGPSNDNYMVLRTDGAKVYATSAAESPTSTYKFADMGNWVYQVDVYASAPTYVKLTAEMHNSGGAGNTQYLKGNTYDDDYDEDDAVILLGGSAVKQHMRIVYDFKTDRMVTSWIPNGDVSGDVGINADVMLIRNRQEEAQQITFASGDGNKLTNVKTVYGVMQFDSIYVNNTALSRYARSLYWISFPFDVNVRDIFGFGTYGKHWILEYYDGMGRAKYGWWADSEPNWKYITPSMKDTFVLKANTGYVLALSLNRMADGCTDVWVKDVNTVYLYFPSATELGTIQNVGTKVMDLSQTGYKCEIDRRTDKTSPDINKDRTIADSYWHCIGVPSFAQNSLSGTATSSTWASNIPFVYEWSQVTNRLYVNTSGSFTFKPMHAYLVQYDGTSITWTNVSNKPSIVSRRKVEGAEADFYEWNLNLMQGAEELDHTYVRMTADENATDGFDFGQDLTKEISTGANIYTFSTYVPVAGNCIPLDLNTTKIVQVGLKIATDGDYTFSMPEGTNGTGVYLVDNIAGTRTNLALTDYSVNLTAGTYDGRFSLEISPIAQTPTDIDNVEGDNVQGTKVRKVMVDGILYIVKDGQVFDARGNRIQ